jgi:hypothetical protein
MTADDPAIPQRKSVALSVILGLVLFLLVLCLLVLSAGFDASKFIYVDF